MLKVDTQQWKVHTLVAVLREVAPDTELQVQQKKSLFLMKFMNKMVGNSCVAVTRPICNHVSKEKYAKNWFSFS